MLTKIVSLLVMYTKVSMSIYPGACYNVDQDCILVSTVDKGKHVYLPWSLL